MMSIVMMSIVMMSIEVCKKTEDDYTCWFNLLDIIHL